MLPLFTLAQVVVGALVTKTAVKEGTALYRDQQIHQETLQQERLRTKILGRKLQNMGGEDLTEDELDEILDPDFKVTAKDKVKSVITDLKEGVKGALDLQ